MSERNKNDPKEEPIKNGTNNLNENNNEKLIPIQGKDILINVRNEIASEIESNHIIPNSDNNEATVKPSVNIAYEEMKEPIDSANIRLEMPSSQFHQSNIINIEFKEVGESSWKANRDASKLERAKEKKCCIIY